MIGLAAHTWLGTLKMMEREAKTQNERDLALLCQELIEAGHEHPAVDYLLKFRAMKAAEG